jgi:hypothetical protein
VGAKKERFMSTGDQSKDKTGSRPSRRQFVQLGAVAVGGGLLAACGGGGDSTDLASLESKPAAKTKMDTPTISCAGSTQASINIQVTAGATGAPAGFSLQWMTLADYVANGNAWYLSDDVRLCKASFSGNANLSRYNLGAGESVTVNVGSLLFDNGASTNCDGDLVCGTDYVFRAFAHANSTLQRSDFTSNLTCSTLACGSTGTCTLTQGYWKTHGPIPTGNNTNQWPVMSFTLGTVGYTDLQWLAIFNTPAGGNGLIALAHQLMAAKLNVASGSDPAAVAAAITAADTLIGALVVPPVGGGFLAPAVTSALTGTLASYNEGAIGPGHCS